MGCCKEQPKGGSPVGPAKRKFLTPITRSGVRIRREAYLNPQGIYFRNWEYVHDSASPYGNISGGSCTSRWMEQIIFAGTSFKWNPDDILSATTQIKALMKAELAKLIDAGKEYSSKRVITPGSGMGAQFTVDYDCVTDDYVRYEKYTEPVVTSTPSECPSSSVSDQLKNETGTIIENSKSCTCGMSSFSSAGGTASDWYLDKLLGTGTDQPVRQESMDTEDVLEFKATGEYMEQRSSC
jgi:hypothetical protein